MTALSRAVYWVAPMALAVVWSGAARGQADEDGGDTPTGGITPGAGADSLGDADRSTEGPPATHRVGRGDTLWTVSEKYFGQPWRWPQLWALNPEITNPHWIFPGQLIHLQGPEQRPPEHSGTGTATATLAPGGEGSAPRRLTRSGGSLGEAQVVRQLGFVDDGTLRAAGTITGSVEEKIMLASGDQAYVEFPRDHPPKAGERDSVYEVDLEHPVREPGSSGILGYLVHVYGDVIIDGFTDRPIANAHLVNLVEPVERGYRVGPLPRRLDNLQPKPNSLSVTARIVASVAPNLLIAGQMLVVLDRGQRHGVAVGNRFVVLRQGDGIKRVMEDWDTVDNRFPPHAVGEIIAIDVQKESSVGWVSYSTRELRVGDVADMRKGY
jgi:LysM domain